MSQFGLLTSEMFSLQEATDFIPWLASNLAALRESIGMNLELQCWEAPVGALLWIFGRVIQSWASGGDREPERVPHSLMAQCCHDVHAGSAERWEQACTEPGDRHDDGTTCQS